MRQLTKENVKPLMRVRRINGTRQVYTVDGVSRQNPDCMWVRSDNGDCRCDYEVFMHRFEIVEG